MTQELSSPTIVKVHLPLQLNVPWSKSHWPSVYPGLQRQENVLVVGLMVTHSEPLRQDADEQTVGRHSNITVKACRHSKRCEQVKITTWCMAGKASGRNRKRYPTFSFNTNDKCLLLVDKLKLRTGEYWHSKYTFW